MLFEDRPTIEVNAKLRKRFLIFRVYEDPIQIRPYQPPDRGYYFDLRNCDIRIIRYTLEDNGFRELPQSKDGPHGSKSSQPSAVMGASLFAAHSGLNGRDGKAVASIVWYVSSVKNQVYQQL